MMWRVYAVSVVLSVVPAGSVPAQPMEKPECSSTADCTSGNSCINGKCVDICGLGLCGPNTDCHVVDLKPLCSCKPNFTGHPFTGCNPGPEPECTSNAECPLTEACMNRQCIDPCRGSCGLNTECRVINHSPVCTCSRGFMYHSSTGCQPSSLPECNTNTNCGHDRACVAQKCVDPCVGLCGNNTICHVYGHLPTCACSPGHSGNPFHGCKPQCSSYSNREKGNDTRTYSECSPPANSLTKKKFHISTNQMSWQDAMVSCRSQDMELAAIESQEEQDQLEKIIQDRNPSTGVWLSGHDLGMQQEFIWASLGKSITYNNWDSGEPFGELYHCLKVSRHDYSWSSHLCSEKNHFICQHYRA